MAAADDVRYMLSSSSDVFAAGATSSPCFAHTFDDEVELDNFGGSKTIIARFFVLVCADDFPNVKDDDLVTVNGISYKVLDTRRIQDGHMLQINLQRSA
jgi:hypothetical protein